MREEIAQLSAAYVDAARDFIAEVRRNERPIADSAVDRQKLPDVEEPYRRGSGGFWISMADGDVIGTVGLVDLGGGQGCLQKMYLRSDFRGTGAALRLLNTVIGCADNHQITEISLGTHSEQRAARRFYEKNGFRMLPKNRIPKNFPHSDLENCFYRRVLVTELAHYANSDR